MAKKPTRKPAKKTGPAYATRNVECGGRSFAIGEALEGDPVEIERVVRIGKASRTFPQNLVDAAGEAEKTRRQAELAADQAASEEFESAVEQTADRVAKTITDKAKGIGSALKKKLTGKA